MTSLGNRLKQLKVKKGGIVEKGNLRKHNSKA